MFQIFTRRFPLNKSLAVNAVQQMRFNSTEKIQSIPKEIREVNLIGTISRDPAVLENGSNLIEIKTFKSDGFYIINRALIRHKKLLEIFGGKLSAGQRVAVKGVLNIQNFKNAEQKDRKSLTVNVHELYASKCNSFEENSNESGHLDENSVLILSRVSSEITHFSNYSMFWLFSHYMTRNMEGNEERVTEFLPVYVHDKNLIQLLQDSVKRMDRVVVKGILNNKADKDSNGKVKHDGYIEATHILRCDKFSEEVDNVIDEKIANE